MKTLVPAIECAIILFFCAAGIGAAHLWKVGGDSTAAYLTMLAIPALASITLVCLAVIVPDLFAVGGLRFPLNFTLPVLYIALVVVTLVLLSRVGMDISREPEFFRPATLWREPRILAITWAGATLSLSAIVAMAKPNRGSAPADTPTPQEPPTPES